MIKGLQVPVNSKSSIVNKLEWDILINDLSGREGKLEFGLCKKGGKVVSSFFFWHQET